MNVMPKTPSASLPATFASTVRPCPPLGIFTLLFHLENVSLEPLFPTNAEIQGRGGSAAVEDRTVVVSRLDDLGLQGQKPKEGNEEESRPVHVDLYGLERREIQNSAESLSLRISFLPLLIYCLFF